MFGHSIERLNRGLFAGLLLLGLASFAVLSCETGGDTGSKVISTEYPETSTACGETVIEEVSIPMRDGEELFGIVRRPASEAVTVPTILLQTPYNADSVRKLYFEETDEDHPLYESCDYAFVVVDWRGFFGSQSAWVLGAGQLRGKDGYDCVEWIAEQSWSDGKVGMIGPSALGRQQFMTAVEHPPHLAAAVPIFAQMNQTYDSYYNGGVLREEYYDFVSAYFGSDIVREHPYLDTSWQIAGSLLQASDINVPLMIVAGWYDLYNTGTIGDFENLVAGSDATLRGQHRLLIGPWIHFATGSESNSGSLRPLTDEEARFIDRERIIEQRALAFFDQHLRGLDEADELSAAVSFLIDGDQGWRQADGWPLDPAERVTYYLIENGSLSGDMPTSGSLQFDYDPDDPSPTIGGSTLWFDLQHGPADQAAVFARDDALTFISQPLAAALSIVGRIECELKVSTTGADTDFAIRLTDVDESGNQLLLTEGIRRLKLRDGYSTPAEVVAGESYTISVPPVNELGYTFAAGHRIGLIVTSSNYPKFALNPNNGDNFYTEDVAAQVVTNTIVLDGGSKLVLPKYLAQ